MKRVENRRQLYEYLVFLAGELRARGREGLSEVLVDASRLAGGMSTEFLGESRIALRRVSAEENGALTTGERSDLSDVLRQLDDALFGSGARRPL